MAELNQAYARGMTARLFTRRNMLCGTVLLGAVAGCGCAACHCRVGRAERVD